MRSTSRWRKLRRPASTEALVRALALCALTGIWAGACARVRASAPVPASAPSQLMDADRAFAAAAAARGLDGWMSFFAPDAVRLTPGAEPVRGTDAIRASDAPTFANPAVRLTWAPVDGGLFADGSHGWTIGRYEVHRRAADGSDTVAGRGRYVTLWRREANGTWRVILDTGSPDPPPR